MSRDDKSIIEKWNERYRQGEQREEPPLPLLVRLAETRTPGRALDLACGWGRHAQRLAECGWQVTAVDASDVAIADLQAHAAKAGLRIDALVADLESVDFGIELEGYDLICDFFYLQRNLFPKIQQGVRPGGLFAEAIHMVDDDPQLKPMRASFLVQPGELRELFRSWTIVYYGEGKPVESPGQRRRAEIIAQR